MRFPGVANERREKRLPGKKFPACLRSGSRGGSLGEKWRTQKQKNNQNYFTTKTPRHQGSQFNPIFLPFLVHLVPWW